VKLVIGIVRPEKANEVMEALYRAEIRGYSISRIQGHGGELDRVETYRGTTVKMGLSEKVRFEIAVSEPFVQPTIDALIEGARTGEVGDGKIFVLDLQQAVRIRTGERAEGAVTPVAP
jgi:nitrogen regulatory protein P-II 1